MNKNELKTRRLALYMTQKEFAKSLGISKSTVSNYETGKSITPLSVLLASDTLKALEPKIIRGVSTRIVKNKPMTEEEEDAMIAAKFFGLQLYDAHNHTLLTTNTLMIEAARMIFCLIENNMLKFAHSYRLMGNEKLYKISDGIKPIIDWLYAYEGSLGKPNLTKVESKL